MQTHNVHEESILARGLLYKVLLQPRVPNTRGDQWYFQVDV